MPVKRKIVKKEIEVCLSASRRPSGSAASSDCEAQEPFSKAQLSQFGYIMCSKGGKFWKDYYENGMKFAKATAILELYFELPGRET